MRTILLPFIAGVFLVGCSASPFDTRAAGVAEKPPQSVESGTRVLWGGQIVDASQVGDNTRLQVRSHPLGYGDRPLIGVHSTGVHFVIHHPDTLDTDQYAPGRYLTALGRYSDVESISMEGKEFQLPVMVSEQIELWPDEIYPDYLSPAGYNTAEVRNTPFYPNTITRSPGAVVNRGGAVN